LTYRQDLPNWRWPPSSRDAATLGCARVVGTSGSLVPGGDLMCSRTGRGGDSSKPFCPPTHRAATRTSEPLVPTSLAPAFRSGNELVKRRRAVDVLEVLLEELGVAGATSPHFSRPVAAFARMRVRSRTSPAFWRMRLRTPCR